jgi:hypothetical protein
VSLHKSSGWRAVGGYLGVLGAITLLLLVGCPGQNGNDGDDNDPNQVLEPNTPDEPDDANEPVDANTPAAVTYHLTITIEGQGAVDTSSGDFDAGAPLSLTASAASGWRFDHWAGDLTGSDNPATLTMDADHAITAVFVGSSGAAMSFYAVYQWIVDDEELGTGIDRIAMSADGKKIFFANGDSHPGTRKGYGINTDGSGLTTYNLPDPGPYGSGGIKRVVTSETGARTYFVPPYDKAIFKLENGALATVSVDKPDGPADVEELAINADGTALVFRDSTRIWSMDQNGGGLDWIVKASEVVAIGGKGESLGNMAAAADGNTIAFILFVRNTATNLLSTEVFCLHGGVMTQITDDRQGVIGKAPGILISGDGSTIIYLDAAQGKYIAVAPDGSHWRAVAPIGGNATLSWCITADGTKMIWSDGSAGGGRMINTDGTGAFDLLPAWNVMTMTIAMTGPLAIAGDGQHMVFRYEYAQWPFKRCLYVGHLNDADAVIDAPKIHNIAFSPAAMPRGNPNATVVLTTMITDPDGAADIQATAADELINGLINGNSADLPVYFSFSPLDDGNAPDATAGDNIYSAVGQPGGKINDYSTMTVRVGARDASNTIVIADGVLSIGS